LVQVRYDDEESRGIADQGNCIDSNCRARLATEKPDTFTGLPRHTTEGRLKERIVMSYPEWVPNSVVALYERLVEYEQNIPDDEDIFTDEFHSNQLEVGLPALRKAMLSPHMQKAWLALEKRQNLAPPTRVAEVIVDMPDLLDVFDYASNKTNSDAFRRLAEDIDSAVSKFCESTGGPAPKKLVEESERFRDLADNNEEIWRILSSQTFVGQRSSASAKRTFTVRRLAQTFVSEYGTPLYATVAAIAAILLDEEPLDADHIRKLVGSISLEQADD
jgi:hypothetical protein